MINSNIYIISYQEFKDTLLPFLLRAKRSKAYLKALISPIVTLYTQFKLFKEEAIYKTEHNASVTLLQKVLNDAFDDIERRIYIKNAEVNETEHYYDPSEGDPLYFYDEESGSPQYFLDPEAYNVYGGDFNVFLPEAIRPAEPEDQEILITQIRAKLDYYKLYGLKYTLIWLNI